MSVEATFSIFTSIEYKFMVLWLPMTVTNLKRSNQRDEGSKKTSALKLIYLS